MGTLPRPRQPPMARSQGQGMQRRARQKPPMGTWLLAGMGGLASRRNGAKSFEEILRGGLGEERGEGRTEATQG